MVEDLLHRYPIVSDQIDRTELRIILNHLETVLSAHVSGAVVEFGCYVGTTSLFIQRMLTAYPAHTLHVYDSFEGLPEKSHQDLSPAGEQFVSGKLKASKAELTLNFKKAGLPTPVIHKGWFEKLSHSDIPDDITFAFLDGDYYLSIKSCLKLIEPKLSPQATVIIDDYQSESLPGARRAVDEWLSTQKTGYALQVAHSLAIIRFR